MIHSRILVEHILHVREVLALLMEHRLQAKCVKYTWAYQKVVFCCFGIEKDSIHTKEHKTPMVMDCPQSENSKNIRCYLDLTSYYRKFIRYYTPIAMPLHAIGTPQNVQREVRR